MRVHTRDRVLTLKIVYYGPGLSGKTTNLVKLHENYPSAHRGDLIQLDTETERTLFFDYFPASIGRIGGFKVRVDFFTVPGQSFYGATRKAVLQGADGIVFVADSDPRREVANHQSKEDMLLALADHGYTLDRVALVYQWNKRDLENAIPVSVLEGSINVEKMPTIEAVANRGVGVKDTQERVLRMTLQNLQRHGLGAASATARSA